MKLRIAFEKPAVEGDMPPALAILDEYTEENNGGIQYCNFYTDAIVECLGEVREIIVTIPDEPVRDLFRLRDIDNIGLTVVPEEQTLDFIDGGYSAEDEEPWPEED